MLKGFRIALVEDDDFMGASLVQRLELEGAEVIWLRQIVRALGALRTPRAPIDAVICDIRLPDGSGEELFSRLCETSSPPPFLFITGHGGIDQAVRLMRAGAADYVSKPFDIPVLLERLANLLATTPQEKLPALLGVSPAARKIETLVHDVAANDRCALIIGGPGTGKGLVARRIHELSDRRAAPFVTVNLAREAKPHTALAGPGGALDRAGEGVLYLHGYSMIGEDAAGMILDLLQEGFPGRILVSCGHEIAEMRDAGGLRMELLYQLDTVEIVIPPLSQRPEDSVWLMHRLFPPMNARRSQPLEGISTLAEQAVRNYPWQGGGRELRARLAQAIYAAPGPFLQASDMFHERLADEVTTITLSEARDAAEKRHIIEVLDRCNGQIGRAARLLRVSRTTLWEKMQKFGIERDQR